MSSSEEQGVASRQEARPQTEVDCAATPLGDVLKIRWLGGNCPVQSEGTLCDLPFYFRARGDSWSFSVAAVADGDPVDVNCGLAEGFDYEEPYGDGPYDAGWMEEAEARDFINKAALLFLKSRDSASEDDGQPDEAQEWADFDPEC